MSNPIERKRMWKDALKNTLVQPKLDIEETINYLDEYEIEKALREAVENKRYNTKLEKRQEKLNENFVWTPEKVEKIRQFNEQMWFRYKEIYDEVCRLKKECDERFAAGDKNYESYDIRSEIWYNHEEGLSENRPLMIFSYKRRSGLKPDRLLKYITVRKPEPPINPSDPICRKHNR